jgi:hypothetical protein
VLVHLERLREMADDARRLELPCKVLAVGGITFK